MITSETVILDLEAYIYKELVRLYNEHIALACAKEMLDCLYLNFRGQLMYIPTSNRDQETKLHDAIYNDFTGSNHKALSIKYKRSLPNIYNIVKSQRAKEFRKLQSDIFPLPDDDTIKPITLIVIEDYLPNNLLKCGISNKDAVAISKNLSLFLCQNYPGISICISDSLRKKRHNKSQLSLF